MISNKMKEDAARINTEIKILATKLPMVFHNYTYHNEDAKVVLKRRNDQLDEMKVVSEFVHEIADFSNLLDDCNKEFENVNEELRRLGVKNMLDDAGANDPAESLDHSSDVKGVKHHNFTISRDDNFIPDTPAISNRKKLDFVKNVR